MVTIEKLNTLNDLEMSIYHYVEAHRDEVVKLKLKDIAEVIHVSPSMITRTAQKIGYDGFVEWKTAIKMENKNHLHHKENKLNYILDYFQKVDNDEFNQSIHQATQIIAQSKEVMFWGVGISGAIAKAGAYLFNRKGKRQTIKCQ
ncbi:MAG: MurR/RpiR family transcriptional regulator [Massilimicrobiota sp.]|nr:MurR/RpiR family transcriptional regulator [Massilimicrobiota sp.]